MCWTRAVVLVSGDERLVSKRSVRGTLESVSSSIDGVRAARERVRRKRNRPRVDKRTFPHPADGVARHKGRDSSSKGRAFVDIEADLRHENIDDPRSCDVPSLTDAIDDKKDVIPRSRTVVFQSRGRVEPSRHVDSISRDAVPVTESTFFRRRDAIRCMADRMSPGQNSVRPSKGTKKADSNAISVQTNFSTGSNPCARWILNTGM
jgi:hypothetical protein